MPSFNDDPVVSRNISGNPEFNGGVYGRATCSMPSAASPVRPGTARSWDQRGAHPGPAGRRQNAGPGIFGQSNGTGVWGESKTWHGVFGTVSRRSTVDGHGGDGPVGVGGVGRTWIGVYGETHAKPEAGSSGVLGEGLQGGVGVKGHARAPGMAGVAGYQLANQGPGIYGEGAPVSYFKGDVVVTGDVTLPGADYAEELTVATPEVTPGMVVVLDETGWIRPCVQEYEVRVAGIVSGARGIRPALVLDRHDGGMPVAFMGKLWLFADATDQPIRCGDLLTTSATPGHAQRATDRERAFGATVGKALTNLESGRGMVRVLVSARRHLRSNT